ncbi:hypothetical protein [Dactylosporangium salmoneum]|uniref:hypothetical protein n=1 Tax=Dactylosporangium salmoneum TaxID=53361 RepID=UPI003CD06B1C
MLRHTFVTTMLDAGVSLRDVQIGARHADPAGRCATTGPATTSTATPTTSSLPTWPPEPDAAARDHAEIRAFRHARFSMRTMTHGASAG